MPVAPLFRRHCDWILFLTHSKMNHRVEAALAQRKEATLRPLLMLEVTHCPPATDKPAQTAVLDGLASLRRVLNTSTMDNATEQGDRFLLDHQPSVEKAPNRAALVCIESADTTTSHTSAALRKVVHTISKATCLREALSAEFESTLALALGDSPPDEKMLHGTAVLLTDGDLKECWQRVTVDTHATTVLVLGRELASRQVRADVEVATDVANDPRTARCTRAQLYNVLEQICPQPQYGVVAH